MSNAQISRWFPCLGAPHTNIQYRNSTLTWRRLLGVMTLPGISQQPEEYSWAVRYNQGSHKCYDTTVELCEICDEVQHSQEIIGQCDNTVHTYKLHNSLKYRFGQYGTLRDPTVVWTTHWNTVIHCRISPKCSQHRLQYDTRGPTICITLFESMTAWIR